MTSLGSSWRPLLDGAMARAANAVVDEVALELEGGRADPLLRHHGLARGFAGSALVLSYLDRVRPDRGLASVAERHLELACDQLLDREMEPSLFNGFLGVAYAYHATGGGDTAQVDDALGELLERPFHGPFDLTGGLVGIGVYATLRRDRFGAACLARVMAQLRALARPVGDGLTWWTAPRFVLAPEEYPRGMFNCGLAHGTPGVLSLVAEAHRLGVAGCAELADGAVRWLLAQRLTDAKAAFPWFVGEDIEPKPSRQGWCYGDVPVALVLLDAARTFGRPAWQDEAMRLLEHGLAFDSMSVGVRDACLCHGSAGLGHLYNRAWQATGDERFAAAARRWFTQTLELHRGKDGVGGFQTLLSTGGPDKSWQSDAGFLVGSAGIAGALAAAVSTVEPSWDHLLRSGVTPAAA